MRAIPQDPRVPRSARRTVNADILNRTVRHSVLFERLKKHEVAKIAVLLDRTVIPRAQDLLTAEIRRSKGFRGIALARLSALLTSQLADLSPTIRASLEQVAALESTWQRKIIASAMPVQIDLNMPSVAVLRQAVDSNILKNGTTSNILRALGASRSRQIIQFVAGEMSAGTTMNDIIDSVTSRNLTKVGDDVATIVRTATNQVSNVAKESVFLDNMDMISSIQIVATLDARTTELCMSLDGKVFPVGEGDRPPFHWNCRTTVIPITKSWKELGFSKQEISQEARASMNGEVPASLTYGDWLKDQSSSFQDDTLGPARAELFRQGLVTVESFVDAGGKRLTLEEIGVRENIVDQVAAVLRNIRSR